MTCTAAAAAPTILKQHPGWRLIQSVSGVFRWITLVGRTYIATPDIHRA
jgi:hypothetical protein